MQKLVKSCFRIFSLYIILILNSDRKIDRLCMNKYMFSGDLLFNLFGGLYAGCGVEMTGARNWFRDLLYPFSIF